jgi:hypothetical protein
VQADVELVGLPVLRAVGEATHVPAGDRVPIHHDDAFAHCREVGGAGQAPRTCPDDDHIGVGSHALSQPQIEGFA